MRASGILCSAEFREIPGLYEDSGANYEPLSGIFIERYVVVGADIHSHADGSLF
jgi:hypothetical protein